MRQLILFVNIVISGLLFQECKQNDTTPDPKQEEYATSISQPELTVYESPSGVPKSFDYSVFVRFDGGEWIDLHEYSAPVNGNGSGLAAVGNMSFVYFDSDFSKRIDVKVEKRGGTVSGIVIRPASAGIQPVVNGNTVEFSLARSAKLSVEFNNDQDNNLMVFANNLETIKPDIKDPNVHYFGPGIHKIGNNGRGTLNVKSNETVYIAGGAVVYGHISIADPSYAVQKNVTIRGRGILSGDMEPGHAYTHPEHGATPSLINLNVADDVKIEGIILHNSVTWNVHMHYCNRIEVRDIKIMGWTINSDGIDPQVCSDILIDDCFIRNHDDCVSIKLSWFGGGIQNRDSRNITIRNSIFWTDQGRAVLIGPELATTSVNKLVENITVKNIDILYVENYTSPGTDWAKGALAINDGDGTTVRNVLFEDIRVDKLGAGTNLITINMVKTPYSGSEGKRVENITFNNVSCNTVPQLSNYVHGFDATRVVSEVTFSNLKVTGSYVHNATEGKFDINDFTENIRFTTTN